MEYDGCFRKFVGQLSIPQLLKKSPRCAEGRISGGGYPERDSARTFRKAAGLLSFIPQFSHVIADPITVHGLLNIASSASYHQKKENIAKPPASRSSKVTLRLTQVDRSLRSLPTETQHGWGSTDHGLLWLCKSQAAMRKAEAKLFTMSASRYQVWVSACEGHLLHSSRGR